MLNIKSLGFIFLFSICFFTSNNVKAQKINQFDANKKRTGVWKKYYPNKRIRYIGQFENGKEVGVFRFYDISDSRIPIIIKTFSRTSDSVSTAFYSLNGYLKSKGFFIGKKRVGSWKYYFPNQKLMSKEFYKDGKLDGELINYYPDGKPAEVTSYMNGMKNGLSKKFTSDGVLIEEVYFKNGKADGLAKYFELNGNLKEKGMYTDGKRTGKWDFYFDGEVASKEEMEKKNTFTKQKKN
mgnify:CR=1 FL=1|jgi:antitoxin component YwqK of YwqJK toxin-antitoxin module